MAYTYDITTDRGKVRLLTRTTGSGSPSADTCVLSDAEIDVFLELAGNVVPLAASMALHNLATNEAYLNNEVRMSGYDSTRGSRADAVSAQADYWERIAVDEGQWARFVEFDWNDNAEAKRILAEALRESGEWWTE